MDIFKQTLPVGKVKKLESEVGKGIFSNIKIAAGTKAGSARSHNEDAVFADAKSGVFVLCDGMGGEVGGGIAAHLACGYLGKKLKNLPNNLTNEELTLKIRKTINEAHQKLREHVSAHPELEGMGTTITLAKLTALPRHKLLATIGHIGDSRAYLLRGKKLIQITLDQNPILTGLSKTKGERFARQVQTELSEAISNNISKEALLLYQYRNVLDNALGTAEFSGPQIYLLELKASQTLLLTSDGIHDQLTDNEITNILNSTADSKQTINLLFQKARARAEEAHFRSKYADDMSCVIIKIEN